MPQRPIVVVTGASGGVGRATSLEFARRGFDVALLARGSAGLTGAARDARSEGALALPITADVANYEEVEAAGKQVEADLGAIDVWVNNAMTTVFAPLEKVEPEQFRRAIEVTFLGQVFGTMV